MNGRITPTSPPMRAHSMSLTMGALPEEFTRRQVQRSAAEATRSLRLAERLRDQGRSHEYTAAIRQHFETFGGGRSAACPLR